jgi:hypothetical protein
MARSHQPDEAVFKAILPEDIDWKPFPAFPPSARLAIVVGEPTKPGPYVRCDQRNPVRAVLRPARAAFHPRPARLSESSAARRVPCSNGLARKAKRCSAANRRRTSLSP